MSSLNGKSILISGGASGIGRAVAELAAEAGASITLCDVSELLGQEAVNAIVEAGGRAHYISCDVRSEEQVKAAVDSAVATYGRLDGICNAAGLVYAGLPTHELSVAAWDRMCDVNLKGSFLLMKEAIPAILASGGGSIVNVASTAGIAAIPNAAEYCATKAGVIGLTRGAAIDYAKRGIRVNCILPGLTRTPMLLNLIAGTPGLEEAVLQASPMGRMADPREVGHAGCWLLSDEPTFVTGIALPVDGGLTAV